jgi:5-hydroxyisourate hydrolase-like protein (transthyretin family)
VGVFEQIAEQRQAADQRAREERGEAALPAEEIHRILSGESPELATARADESIPAGTIRVLVVDQNGQPTPEQAVELAIMGQNDQRTRREVRTGADGRAEFAGLPTGQSQAYRINVPFRGAKYSSSPFQLPPNAGYDVRIIRLPTTRDERAILQLVHRTFLELTQDERVRVAHQIQLVNLGRETFLLPASG